MKSRRRQTVSPESNLPLLVQTILVVILFFVAIGDGFRYIVSFAVSVFPSVIRYAIAGTRGATRAVKNLFTASRANTRKAAKKVKPPVRKSGETDGTRPRSFLRNGFTVPRIPRWPAIHIPALRMPVIRLPRLRLPAIRLPLPVQLKPSIRPDRTDTAPRRYLFSFDAKSVAVGIVVTLFFIFIPYNGWLFISSLPNPRLLSQRDIPVSTKIFDRNGTLLYEIYADQNRTPVTLSEIPPYVKDATIAIEDREFYRHPGFSIKGIVRAAKEDLSHQKLQGGSTITQQLIKSALLTPDISFIRKFKEVILAFWAERLFSKDQILEMYLNQVPYGGTAWGIEAAAQTYFHKDVSALTLAEAALLAGLPAAPSDYSPFGSHPEKAIARQRDVLRSMVEAGFITPDMMQNALGEKLAFATPQVPIRAPHFVMYVKAILEKQFGSRLVEQGGLRVTTSLDLSVQDKVQQIVRTNIDALSAYNVGNGAALVTDPRNGQILAMVGSRDYFDTAHDGNVNLTLSLRQPGSSIKVVTYAEALEHGMTAATLINDSPTVYNIAGSTPYAPVNYDGRFHGLVPLRAALANSYNIPAVKTLATVGVSSMMQKAKLMGIDSWSTDPSRYGLSLTLGSAEVTMLDMAEVYGTLANGGKRVDVNPILEVKDYAGHELIRQQPAEGVQAISADVAWILTNILSDNAARTPAFGPNSGLVIPGKTVAVKTGTTNDKRDNWADGYTPSVTVIVWVGNNDNSPMNPAIASGITGATPIWHDIMTELLKNRPDEIPPMPETVVPVPCYFGKDEYFVKGTEPSGRRCSPIPTPTVSPAPGQ